MPKPKEIIITGKTVHVSVGAVIERDGKILLMDRREPPFGWAGPAGHIDDGEEPDVALAREVKEETGLTVVKSELLVVEFVPWNICSYNITGHQWYVYACEAAGELLPNIHEAKDMQWYSRHDLADLVLEPVWEYWLKKISII